MLLQPLSIDAIIQRLALNNQELSNSHVIFALICYKLEHRNSSFVPGKAFVDVFGLITRILSIDFNQILNYTRRIKKTKFYRFIFKLCIPINIIQLILKLLTLFKLISLLLLCSFCNNNLSRFQNKFF